MNILVLQHVAVEHPGVFRDFLRQDGLTWRTVELDEGEPIPELEPFDLMIVMGGPQDVWEEDQYPWLREEKAAIRNFVQGMAAQLAPKGIRVNGVAPGPIWTPLIPSTFPPEKVANFGKDTPMKRPGQPEEVAACYVFLASEDSSYIAGQILHPNGGEVVNG